MEQLLFYQSFRFNRFHRARYHYTDNRSGAECHYIAYMYSGQARLVCQGEEVLIDTGDFFYIPHHCRYESYWYGSPDICFDSLGFLYFPEMMRASLPMQKIEADPEIRALHAALAADLKVSCRSVGLFYQLLGLLLPKMATRQSPPRQAAVERAVHQMHLSPELRVPELARSCGMSESALYSAFQDILGVTPVEMKHRILAEKAIQLLSTTDEPIEAVSAALGFSSAAYFRKVLRAQTGKSPREIRKNSGL